MCNIQISGEHFLFYTKSEISFEGMVDIVSETKYRVARGVGNHHAASNDIFPNCRVES